MSVKISIIMGIYNCASTLKEAMDSLLSQTYQDFEVIICDGGLSDNTVEVAQKYLISFQKAFLNKSKILNLY